MFRKLFFSWLIIFLILLYPLEKISNYLVEENLKKGVRGVFLSKKNFEFLKYIKQIHHVRDIVQWESFTSELNNNNNLLFSKIETKKIIDKNSELLLINGDSWAEMTFWKKIPKEILTSYSIKNDTEIIVAGISSFSTSPMLVQLRILRNKFNFRPNKIISFFDYTDFGDEICRYKSKLSFSDGRLISVNPETYRMSL